MLVFVLALMACGLIALVGLIAFLSENLIAVACTILAGRAARWTGSGWPGDILTGALTFTIASALIRLALALFLCPLRLFLRAVIVAPGTVIAFTLTYAVFSGLVPSAGWRLTIVLLAAAAFAVGAGGRSLGHGMLRDQTRI